MIVVGVFLWGQKEQIGSHNKGVFSVHATVKNMLREEGERINSKIRWNKEHLKKKLYLLKENLFIIDPTPTEDVVNKRLVFNNWKHDSEK